MSDELKPADLVPLSEKLDKMYGVLLDMKSAMDDKYRDHEKRIKRLEVKAWLIPGLSTALGLFLVFGALVIF